MKIKKVELFPIRMKPVKPAIYSLPDERLFRFSSLWKSDERPAGCVEKRGRAAGSFLNGSDAGWIQEPHARSADSFVRAFSKVMANDRADKAVRAPS